MSVGECLARRTHINPLFIIENIENIGFREVAHVGHTGSCFGFDWFGHAPDYGRELGSVWVGLEWRSGSIDFDASACVQDCGARFLGSLLGVRSLCRSSIECSYSSSSRGLSHGASRASSSMTLGVWYGTLGVGSRDRGVMVSSRGFPQGSSRVASLVVTSRVW